MKATELLQSYSDLEFALNWRDIASPDEEVEQAIKEWITDDYDPDQELEVRSTDLETFVDEQWEYLHNIGLSEQLVPFFDMAAWLKELTLCSNVYIIKTESGYCVLETDE